MALSKEIVTKTVGNGLRIDVLVDAQDPSANGNGHKTVTNGLVEVVVSMRRQVGCRGGDVRRRGVASDK